MLDPLSALTPTPYTSPSPPPPFWAGDFPQDKAPKSPKGRSRASLDNCAPKGPSRVQALALSHGWASTPPWETLRVRPAPPPSQNWGGELPLTDYGFALGAVPRTGAEGRADREPAPSGESVPS